MHIETLEDLEYILSKYCEHIKLEFYGSDTYRLECQSNAEEVNDKQSLFNQIYSRLKDMCTYKLSFDLNNNEIYNEHYDVFRIWDKIIILIDVDSLENDSLELEKTKKIDDIWAQDLQVTIPPDIIQKTQWLRTER